MAPVIVRIVGVGRTAIGRLGRTSSSLAVEALNAALSDAHMQLADIDALVAVPSLSSGQFMHAHHIATISGLAQARHELLLRTVDTGGAGPITALGTAKRFIEGGWAKSVAIVASDAVLSMSADAFLRSVEPREGDAAFGGLPRPPIPHGYDRYAQWHMRRYGLRREQLAMVPVLMGAMAARHPDAMCQQPMSLEEVLRSRRIAPVTNLLECARRADGAAALIVSHESHYQQKFATEKLSGSRPVVVSVGESSGPLFPPDIDEITPETFSCVRATRCAFRSAQLNVSDIQFFGLYDCFPICLVRAIEAVGLCPTGEGGAFIEAAYNRMQSNNGVLDQNEFPINTHGGLLCFGAPWEVPAMYNVAEAVAQLGGTADKRQITPTPKRALVYGNGGIFSASAVAILGNGEY